MQKRNTEDGLVAVTFVVPPEVGARRAFLVGSCTAWAEVPMNPQPDGSFELVVELPRGNRYEFRYHLDDERWDNAWDADEYARNPYGGDDSVVIT